MDEEDSDEERTNYYEGRYSIQEHSTAASVCSANQNETTSGETLKH